MREGYVLLNLNQDQQPFLSNRKSLWRTWNQLSRLQRSLITGSLMLLSLLCVIYFWRSSEDVYVPSLKMTPISERIGLAEFPLKFKQLEPKVDSEVEKPVVEEPQQRAGGEGRILSVGGDVEQVVVAPDVPPNKPILPPLPPVPPHANVTENEIKVTERQQAVVQAFKHAWTGYVRFAWGHDHLKPISQRHHDWFKLGLSIVDSLDTMNLMGLNQELAAAREWIANGLNLNTYNDVNLFEVTIRVLGGLLSAYHLSADRIYLEKAIDLGERLLPCFTRSPSPIPYSDVNLASHNAHSPRWGPDSSTSEVTTLQLEFRDLSRASNQPKFEEAASRVSLHVHTLPKTDGLVPVFINPRTGQFQSYADIKLGARGDSYYEYLVKQWIQTGKTIDYLRDDYLEAVDGMKKHLTRRTPNSKLLFVGELKGGSRDFVPKMDHLACYLPGTLALGYHHGLPKSHMELAEELIYTCYRTYAERPTFLAPEITYFNLQKDGRSDMYVKTHDAHNLLRPEFIESLWYLYQITGNKTYQDWGWTIFQAFEKYTKVEWGYTSIGNVNNPKETKPRDMMESFFLSETLKYLFLLFSDNRKLVDISKYVINSEGHPMPVYSS
ncbi:alpha-Mannosidase class I b [Rhodnius prolixus]|uniref:alpha-1,2-Mannosidase n=1 Tax=Rhodnius prolixus TaxID=13249 RepID=A0ABL0EI03_RHOPR